MTFDPQYFGGAHGKGEEVRKTALSNFENSRKVTYKFRFSGSKLTKIHMLDLVTF